jgi:hypothetical protein
MRGTIGARRDLAGRAVLSSVKVVSPFRGVLKSAHRMTSCRLFSSGWLHLSHLLVRFFRFVHRWFRAAVAMVMDRSGTKSIKSRMSTLVEPRGRSCSNRDALALMLSGMVPGRVFIIVTAEKQ